MGTLRRWIPAAAGMAWGVVLLLGELTAAFAAAPGTLDRSFGAGFGYVRYADSTMTVEDNGLGIAVQPDGKLIVAGTSGITTAAVVVGFYAAVATHRFGLDPDNHGVPMVTSSLDLLGALSLILAIVILGLG